MLILLVAVAAAACSTFTGPKEQHCRWHYTAYAWRDTTIVDQKRGTSITVRIEIPIDSVKICRAPSGA